MAGDRDHPSGRYVTGRFRWRPSHRLVDGTIVLVAGGMSLIDYLAGFPVTVLQAALAAGAGVALWWRRQPSFISFMVILGLTIFATLLSSTDFLFLPVVVALYSIAKYGEISRSLFSAAAMFLLTPLLFEWSGLAEVGVVAASVLVPWLLGDRVRLIADRRAALLQRIDDLEFDNQRSTREAITQERLRFARELHDVVSHSISAIMLNAGGARSSSIDMDDDVRELFSTIELTARRELGEIRQLLHALRTGSDLADAGPSVHLMDVSQLADRHRVDGVEVRIDYVGHPRPLSPNVELAGYRIIHEALSNARSHGEATVVTVHIVFTDRSVRIAVIDNGGPTATPEPFGLGLIGMRERVDLLSGTFKAGPTTEGFEVHAEIPAAVRDPVLP